MGCSNSTTAQSSKKAPQQAKVAGVLLTDEPAEEKALKQLKVIFKSIDVDEDGSVSSEELKRALRKDSRLPSLVQKAGLNHRYAVLEQMDSDADGRVTWEEFQQSLKSAAVGQVLQSEDVGAFELASQEVAVRRLRRMYDSIDKNGDGFVSKQELAATLKKDARVADLLEIAGVNIELYVFEQLDKDQDGCITWEEFQEQLCGAAKLEVKRNGEVDCVLVFEREPEGVCGACPHLFQKASLNLQACASSVQTYWEGLRSTNATSQHAGMVTSA